MAEERLAADTFLLFLRVLRARFPGVGDFQQRLAIFSAHLARDAETIRRVFSEFVRFQQPRLLSPCKEATPIFGTLFSNNFVM